MSGIYVIAAELNGQFSSRPTASLREMMITAASRAIERANLGPDEIDALFGPEGC